MRLRPDRVVTSEIGGTRFHLHGAPRTVWRDAYHAFLRASWPLALGALVVAYLLLNGLFAVAYHLVGGVTNMNGSLLRAFYFSVQTMGTIGYGAMYPESDAANLLVVAESVCGLVITALSTGLVFAKFGRTAARVLFADRATVARHDGQPTLQIRVGNERLTALIDVRFRVAFARTERSREGVLFYRSYDLTLARPELSSLRSSFTLLHVVDAASPLAGYDAERLRAEEGELLVTVAALDEVTLQPVHATWVYDDAHVVFGARPADMLSPRPDGSIDVHLERFHDVVPVPDE